jgi:XTP/dITP diphosphohydrolase
MKKLAVATGNPGKLREIREALAGLPLELLSLSDFPDAPVPAEDGDTFFANALKKAAALAQHSGLPALADDSGLAVDALDGDPGVFSARYAGPRATDADNVQKLMAELRARPGAVRSARFIAAVVLCFPDGSVIHARGECEGEILDAPRGVSGFGYDPVFYYPPLRATFAEISAAQKLAVSHRGRALRELAARLGEWLRCPDRPEAD